MYWYMTKPVPSCRSFCAVQKLLFMGVIVQWPPHYSLRDHLGRYSDCKESQVNDRVVIELTVKLAQVCLQ